MRFPSQWQLYGFLAGTALLSILTVACEDGEEAGTPTPTSTATASPVATTTPTVTATATATASATPMPTPLVGPPVTVGPLTIQVGTDKEIYQKGEPVVLFLTIAASEPTTLYYRTSQRFDFMVADADGEQLWRWSADRAFLQVLGQEELEPGMEFAYQEVWRQVGSWESQVSPGVYTVTGESTHCDENYDNCGAAVASTTIEVAGG